MKKQSDAAVCKQCGKIVVGSSKMGLCESCFNKDAGRAIKVVAVGQILWLAGKRYLPKAKKYLPKVLELFRK